VRLALGRLTQAVELQAHVLETQLLPQGVGQQDQLGVDLSPRKSQGLGTDLVKLAVATALRTLVPEHRPHVIKPLAAVVQHRVLGHGTHHARGIFGAQGQGFAVEFVLEGVHLFFDDVGHLAQATHKQRRGFDDGGADVAVGMAGHQLAHLVFEPLPLRRLGRQDVVHAFDGGKLFKSGRGRRSRGGCLGFLGHKDQMGSECGAKVAAPKRFSM